MCSTATRMHRNELPQMTRAAANSNSDFRVTAAAYPS
jgi:hypothetical protein